MEHSNIISQFDLKEPILSCNPHGNGHINSTFILSDKKGSRYILQRINTSVFKKPEQVMSNIYKVTEYLKKRSHDPRSVMSLVPLKNGENFLNSQDGCWRMYKFIESSVCLDTPETSRDFYECGVGFGTFQRQLRDFPAEELFETIPDFHNTPKRYLAFLEAVEADTFHRAEEVKEEIEFIKSRADFMSVLFDAHKNGRLPLRVTHNDTKINNIMLDSSTRSALCVIDLDTIMPGFSATDFGDSIRSGAVIAAEDEKDLSRVELNLEYFEAYTAGFLDGCGGLLDKDEIRLFPEGAKIMTLECGMRFLTDYLEGDTYFKTSRPKQNLDRCRTQLKLVSDMEKHWDTMKEIINKYL